MKRTLAVFTLLLSFLAGCSPAAASTTEPTTMPPTATAPAPAEATSTNSPEPSEMRPAEITPSPKEVIWTIKSDPNPLALPSMIAVDGEDTIYVVDGEHHRIQKFDQDGKTLAIWAGPEHGSQDGQFWFNVGGSAYGDVKVDQAGDVYVADHNNRIQVFDSNGTFLRKFGECCEGDGKFRNLATIAVDDSGNVYAFDVYTSSIQRFDPDGNFVLRWELPPCHSGGNSNGGEMAADADGTIYVANFAGNCIQHFDSEGKLLNQWGEFGDRIGQLDEPIGLALDRQGNVYVSNHNRSNEQIQKFDSQGTLLAVWNGFDLLMGMAVDSEGNIYAVEHIMSTVIKFRPR